MGRGSGRVERTIVAFAGGCTLSDKGSVIVYLRRYAVLRTTAYAWVHVLISRTGIVYSSVYSVAECPCLMYTTTCVRSCHVPALVTDPHFLTVARETST